ncbi:transporter [Streptacidiphilus sp. ASG 303]|uniref:transporter n=1 Tax=Streptacidiphilus sp. ASG 303 TaxID=2896847 RepID=UPI001E35F5BE|nr:transporter [Streptacidiphilus sp. ASG 303]MCD0481999.1 transporter [Streptacidiphilus sp. ASG 303]
MTAADTSAGDTPAGGASAGVAAPARGAAADRDVVRAVVSLKVRLLRNGLRRNGGRAVAYVVGSALGLLLASGTAVALAALHGHRGAGDAAVVVATGLALGWAGVPLFLFAGDESADPTRLTMLPLRPSPLLRGMLLAALVGPGPLLSAVVLGGAAAAAAAGAAGAATAVAAVPLAVLTLVVLSRAVAAGNARMLSSRRGRDLAVFGGLLFAVLIQSANIAFQGVLGRPGTGGVDLSALEPAGAVLRWVPPVSALGAVRSAGDGAWAAAAVQLAAAAGLLVLLLRWWRASLQRLMVTADSSTLAAAPEVREARRGGGLSSRLLPADRSGAALQRQLRYVRREPRARAAVFSGIGMMAALSVLAAVQGGMSVYTVAFGGLVLGLQTLNLFGMDGSAFWMVAATIAGPADARAELRGRVRAVAAYAVPSTALLGAVLAAFGGGWADLPEALGLTWGLLGGGAGVGAVLSVLLPYAMPAGGNPMQNAAPGQAGLVLGNMFGSMLGVVVLTVPLGVAALALHLADGPTWTVLPAGALYGAGMAALGVRLAGRLLPRRLPEVLAAVVER